MSLHHGDFFVLNKLAARLSTARALRRLVQPRRRSHRKKEEKTFISPTPHSILSCLLESAIPERHVLTGRPRRSLRLSLLLPNSTTKTP